MKHSNTRLIILTLLVFALTDFTLARRKRPDKSVFSDTLQDNIRKVGEQFKKTDNQVQFITGFFDGLVANSIAKKIMNFFSSTQNNDKKSVEGKTCDNDGFAKVFYEAYTLEGEADIDSSTYNKCKGLVEKLGNETDQYNKMCSLQSGDPRMDKYVYNPNVLLNLDSLKEQLAKKNCPSDMLSRPFQIKKVIAGAKAAMILYLKCHGKETAVTVAGAIGAIAVTHIANAISGGLLHLAKLICNAIGVVQDIIDMLIYLDQTPAQWNSFFDSYGKAVGKIIGSLHPVRRRKFRKTSK